MATEEGSGGGGGGGGGAGAGEKKSSQAPAKPGAGGAGKFLAGLPSRGNFSSGSGSVSSNLVQTLTLKTPLLYICTFFARWRGEVGSEPVLSRCDLRREGSGFTSASTARIPQVSGFSLRFYEESA